MSNTGTILITGGAGFIGTHLAERLTQTATKIILLDSFRRDSLAALPSLRERPNIEVRQGDITDPQSLREAFAGVDTVLHLAAIAGVSSYYKESLRTLEVNILGTVNVLAEAARCKVKRFVHFSTSEIFGPNALWVTEENSPAMGPSSERRWVYATSKLAGEHFSLRYGEQHGFGTTVIRPFNVYGPRQTGEGAISNFCAAAVGGKGIKIYGDGSPLRAWCYVSDFVDAVIAVLQNDRAIGQSFNIGNPTEVETTLGLARRVQRIVPEVAIEFEHVERAEVRARVPDIKKARELLGFNPKIDLDEGLKRTLSWFRERRSV